MPSSETEKRESVNKKKLRMSVYHYGPTGQYSVAAHSVNTAKISDKLVRLTAKITERYAGDVGYILDAFHRAKQQDAARVWILCFRESGVDSYDITDAVLQSSVSRPLSDQPSLFSMDVPNSFSGRSVCPLSECIQTWLLETYAANDGRDSNSFLSRIHAELC